MCPLSEPCPNCLQVETKRGRALETYRRVQGRREDDLSLAASRRFSTLYFHPSICRTLADGGNSAGPRLEFAALRHPSSSVV